MQFYDLDRLKITSTSKEELILYFRDKLLKNKTSDLIITFNTDFYRTARLSKDFFNVCSNADLIVPDGKGIIFLLKLKYGVKVNCITGTDIFEILLELANELQKSVSFVGSSALVLKKLRQIIFSEYPDLKIASLISPPIYFEQLPDENEKVLKELKNNQPDILFLALGSPRQETWLNAHKDFINSKINVGVGAVFDFYTQTKKRSPVFLQNLGLEWFWRFLNEPKRLFKRYFINDLPFFMKEASKIMKHGRKK